MQQQWIIQIAQDHESNALKSTMLNRCKTVTAIMTIITHLTKLALQVTANRETKLLPMILSMKQVATLESYS